jgi:predicted metal-binding transcription factor (methanogenesis marker protein 9)
MRLVGSNGLQGGVQRLAIRKKRARNKSGFCRKTTMSSDTSGRRHCLTTLGFCCATTMLNPGREVQAEWLGTSDAYRVSSKP